MDLKMYLKNYESGLGPIFRNNPPTAIGHISTVDVDSASFVDYVREKLGLARPDIHSILTRLSVYWEKEYGAVLLLIQTDEGTKRTKLQIKKVAEVVTPPDLWVATKQTVETSPYLTSIDNTKYREWKKFINQHPQVIGGIDLASNSSDVTVTQIIDVQVQEIRQRQYEQRVITPMVQEAIKEDREVIATINYQEFREYVEWFEPDKTTNKFKSWFELRFSCSIVWEMSDPSEQTIDVLVQPLKRKYW